MNPTAQALACMAILAAGIAFAGAPGDTAPAANPKGLTSGPTGMAEKLIIAARTGKVDQIRILLDQGADINARMGPGLTALHIARIFHREAAAALLLEKGADANIPMPAKDRIADWIITRVVAGDCPAAVVLVARDGKILYEKGFGYASLESKTPATPQTIFRIGSVTKQFTAAAVLRLQEQGKLRIEDKLSKFIPDYPRGDEVTLYHLLTHTSGIHNYTSKPNLDQIMTTGATAEEMIRSFQNDPYDFDPGEKHQYSNSGYFLLGYIVEQVSGQALGDYLRDTFFLPLGMKSTGLHRRGLALHPEAVGYSCVGGKVQRALDPDMSSAGGAGALYSTVGDLCRWNEALFNGRVISPSSLDAALTPCVLADGRPANATGGPGYGFGLTIAEHGGLKVISHGGAGPGFASHLMRVYDKKLTVAVLVNCVPLYPNLSPTTFAYDLAQVYLYEPRGI
jgi:CubicO group peptidase (beta-lactamase class C family)